MKKRLAIGLLSVFVAALLAGCGGDPIEARADHYEELTEIIKDNIDEPDEAIAEIKEYYADNKEDLEEIKKELEEELKDMSQQERQEFEKESREKLQEPLGYYKGAKEQFAKKNPTKGFEMQTALAPLEALLE